MQLVTVDDCASRISPAANASAATKPIAAASTSIVKPRMTASVAQLRQRKHSTAMT
jgi:hypothetical protein